MARNGELERILQEYEEEVGRYRRSRKVALALYDSLAERFDGDVHQIKEYVKSLESSSTGGGERGLVEQTARSAVDNEQVGLSGKLRDNLTFSDLANIVENHETELRIGTEAYSKLYEQTVEKGVAVLEKRAILQDKLKLKQAGERIRDVRKKKRRRYLTQRAKSIFSKETETPTWDEFWVPLYDRNITGDFRTRNKAGFYENTIILPVRERGDNGLKRGHFFTKFFNNEIDWKRNKFASKYMDSLDIQMPVPEVLAEHGDEENYLAVSEHIAGKPVEEILGDSYAENRPFIKAMVDRTALIHSLGGKKSNRKRAAKKAPKEIKETLYFDPETYFIVNYTARRKKGRRAWREALQELGYREGEIPSRSQIMEWNDREREEDGDYDLLYSLLEKKVFTVLRDEMKKREENDELAFLPGDCHSGNFMVPVDEHDIPDITRMAVIDPEAFVFGLGEFDLYRILESSRNLVERQYAGEATREVLPWYTEEVRYARGALQTDLSAVYPFVKCVQDFVTYSRLADYVRNNDALSDAGRQMQQDIAEEYRGRANAFVYNQSREEVPIAEIRQRYEEENAGLLTVADEGLPLSSTAAFPTQGLEKGGNLGTVVDGLGRAVAGLGRAAAGVLSTPNYSSAFGWLGNLIRRHPKVTAIAVAAGIGGPVIGPDVIPELPTAEHPCVRQADGSYLLQVQEGAVPERDILKYCGIADSVDKREQGWQVHGAMKHTIAEDGTLTWQFPKMERGRLKIDEEFVKEGDIIPVYDPGEEEVSLGGTAYKIVWGPHFGLVYKLLDK